MVKLRFERSPHFDTFMELKSAKEFEERLTKKSLYEWCRSFRFIYKSDLSYKESNAKSMAKQLFQFREEINRDAPVPKFITPSIVSNLTENERRLWWRLWNAKDQTDASLISALQDYIRDRFLSEEENAPSGYPTCLVEVVKFDSNPDEYVAPQSATNSNPGVNQEHDEDESRESGDDGSESSSSTVSEIDNEVCFCVASFHVSHNYCFFPTIIRNLS